MRIKLKQWLMIFVALLLLSSPAHAADFKWVDENGSTNSLAELKGQPVLVHVWASWCPACLSELPGFADWLQQHPDIRSIPVSLDSSKADAIAFLTSRNITMPVLLTDTAQARKLGVRGLPTTFVIAADGSISQQHLGPRDWRDEVFSQQLLNALRP